MNEQIKYLGEFPAPESDEAKYSKEEMAIEYIGRYGYIDGAHHKQWVLDQVARILLGTPVIVTEARWSNGESEIRLRTGDPSGEYLEWRGDDFDEDDEGIAP
jgi:hypothetical protein